MVNAVRKRRKKVRQMAVAYKGGRCERCGYDRCTDALEFHHKNRSQKDFGISEKGYTRSWARVRNELDKCVLICANCHRELHTQLAALAGNGQVIQRVNSGNPREIAEASISRGNPEPSPPVIPAEAGIKRWEGAETRHSPPKDVALAASMVKG